MKIKKSEKTILRDRLDKKFSLLIRQRDKGVCQKCGKALPSAQCAHIFTRSINATRWYMRNALTLCYYCHIGGNLSAHRDPVGFTNFVKAKLGYKYEELELTAIKTVKVNKEFYENIENYLKEVEIDLNNGGEGEVSYPYK